jgi:hypothetical protein
VEAICDKWRSLDAGIFLKGFVNCSNRNAHENLGDYILIIRDKWEMCVKGMTLLLLSYVDNVGDQTGINC